METAKKQEKKGMGTISIVLIMAVIIYILSMIIPSGTYDRVDNQVIPGSYHQVEKVFVNPLMVIKNIPVMAWQGMGKLFISMMCVGGAISVLTESRALDLGIYKITEKFRDKALLLIPILFVFTGFLGSLGALISTIVAFVPLGMVISKRLKVDNVFAIALMYLGSYTGFLASPISPLTTALGQEIAGIPVFSGAGFRTVLTLTLLGVTVVYLCWYAARVRKDPTKSVMEHIDFDDIAEEDMSGETMSKRQAGALIMFFASFLFFAYGSIKLKFGTTDLAAIMLTESIISTLICGWNLDEGIKVIVKGAQNMVYTIFLMIIGMSITVILNMSGITDSIVYYLSIPLNAMGTYMASIGMFIANAIINLVITSGSGQCMVVMPIMAPLADVVGITRQTAILAYQCGDGFTNLLNPINVMLLGSLGLAKCSMKHWFKLVLPLYAVFFVIICAALCVAVAIGW